jgi:hypothetical protein
LFLWDLRNPDPDISLFLWVQPAFHICEGTAFAERAEMGELVKSIYSQLLFFWNSSNLNPSNLCFLRVKPATHTYDGNSLRRAE